MEFTVVLWVESGMSIISITLYVLGSFEPTDKIPHCQSDRYHHIAWCVCVYLCICVCAIRVCECVYVLNNYH